MFKGDLLHGVIPGLGLPVDSKGRRISVMIAFWKDIRTRPFNDAIPCAAQSFPTKKEAQERSSYTWMKEMYAANADESLTWSARSTTFSSAKPSFVPKVWIPIAPLEENTGRGFGHHQAKQSPSYTECFQGF